MTVNGTSLPPWYKGKGFRKPPEPRSRDRFRINLAKTAGL
jgi:hypothetical protein